MSDLLKDKELNSVNGGAVGAVKGDTIPVEAVNEFIRTCKNSWGMSCDQAIDHLNANWSKYEAEWTKSGVTPSQPAIVTYIKAHWNNIF